MSVITYREAVSQALKEALEEDDRTFLIGEDIGPYGGAFAVTKGLWEQYGQRRIKDSPLSESVITGAGVGAAMAGLRPIVELMTINFSLLASDQIVNHAAKLRYMSNGQFSIPLIIRTVTGSGAGVSATHSQCLEGWFASVPGLQVVVPTTPNDVLGLFRSCRDLDDPVLFVEHIMLYSTRGEVNDSPEKIPIGLADVKREGRDLSIISYSRMVQVSLTAADVLSKYGIEAEVIDLRSLRPLDIQTLVDSVKKTHNVLVVEEAPKLGGFAGEVIALVQQEAFDFLDGPISRIAGEEVPIPFSYPLEQLSIPDVNGVVQAARGVLNL